MSRAPLLCPDCGAKNHPGWRRCQRCRADLVGPLGPSVPVADAAAGGEPGRSSVPWLSAVALVAIAAVVWVALPDRAARTEAPVVQAAGFVPAAGPAPAATVVAPASDQGVPVPGYAGRRGIASYRDGDLDGAIADFEEAVAASPQDAESLNNLGQVFVRQGRISEALPLFDRAITLSPDKWAFRFNRARARGLVNDWPGAVEGYREADRAFPDDHVTLFNLGLALRRTGQHAEAASVLERVVSQGSPEASWFLPLGQTYEATSRPTVRMGRRSAPGWTGSRAPPRRPRTPRPTTRRPAGRREAGTDHRMGAVPGVLDRNTQENHP
jgi:Flp pilus assembly protein TadD